MVYRLDTENWNSPIDVQLTKHVTNLIVTYGSKIVLYEFKQALTLKSVNYMRVSQIIDYYGLKKCQDWFTLIYGWEFNKEEVA